MDFTIFLTALLILYGAYYLVIILSEIISKRNPAKIDDSQLDFVFPSPANLPQKVGHIAEPVNAQIQDQTGTDAISEKTDFQEEKEGDDLQGDLGLETITEGIGIEVSEENLQKVLEQNS